MKKLCFFSLVLFTSISSKAQSLEDINKLMDKQQYAAAKVAIDKFIADPKNANSTEGWYYKGRIYNALSKDTTVPKQDAFNYKITAFDAFKKNQQLDKLDLRMKSELYISYLDLYIGFYDLGAKNFNLKDFTSAYTSYLRAQEMENFILSKNYTYDEMKLNKLDTSLVMIIAVSALQGGDTANAIINYRRIINANITGVDYERVYEYLAGYYLDKNDDSNAQLILAKAKLAYPTSNIWNSLELDKLSKSGDTKAVLAKYEELYKSDPGNFANSYNYSIEMFNYLWANDNKTPDTLLFDKLSSVLRTAMKVDVSKDAQILLTNHLFNVALDYNNKAALIKETKTTKPADLIKKKELNALSIRYMNEFINSGEQIEIYYTEKGAQITTKQKIGYKQLLNLLSDAYRVKGDLKKSAEYDKKIDTIKF